MFVCDVCSKSFSHKTNMYRHRRSHNVQREPACYECNYCGNKEKNKKVFIKHVRQHNQNSKRGIRLKCPECDDKHLKSYKDLDDHLTKIHCIGIKQEYFEFENEGEFCTWKINVEKDTQSQYSAIRGIRKQEHFTQREYICHRSYNKKSNSTQNKKASKSLGTNKIGFACPSRMIVKFTADKVIVNFTPEHVGHSNEAIRMRLPSHQRAAIAEKLRNGVTIQGVLDDIRDSGPDNSVNFERLHYIQKSDIHNIIRDYNIIKLTKNCPSQPIQKIRAAHSKRSQISDEDITCIQQGKIWRVKSQKDKQFSYEVKQISNDCLCILRCSQCEVCVHSYQCTCVDNVRYLNICKHIHKIAGDNKTNSVESGSSAIQVHKTLALLESHPKLMSNVQKRNHSDLSEDVRTKMQLMLQFHDTLSIDELEYVSKVLDDMMNEIKFNK